ncbi:MAG: FHA domain-containing protein [Cyanobacteria bacterium P01_A01_bin.135]
MITCPNCAYQNSDGAGQCAACASPLPVVIACPVCGASCQADARFCGSCGASLSEATIGQSGKFPCLPTTEETAFPRAEVAAPSVYLRHMGTGTALTLPALPVVRLGKPNSQIPPDLDVSGFPDSGVVSRVHATIHREGEAYYIEDAGSSNGTYVNNLPLAVGSRRRLRQGDRIALGKEDKVAFSFEMDR